MPSTRTFSSLFQTPGPWLHAKTVELGSTHPPSAQDLADIIQRNNPAVSSDQALTLVSSVLEHSRSVVRGLNFNDRNFVGRYLGITNIPGPGVLNNVSSPAIKTGLLPLFVLDAILHSSEPNSTATPVPKDTRRPETKKHHYDYFLRSNKWHDILTRGHRTHLKAKQLERPAIVDLDAMDDTPKKRCLAGLQALNSVSSPGDTTHYNIVQAAFMLTAMIQGKCILTEQDVIDIAWSEARLEDATITRDEVADVIRKPNAQGIPSVLAVADTSTPLHLFTDRNFATKEWSPGTSVYNTWKSAGNSHYLDLSHPLGRLNRKFWPMLLSVAVKKMTAADLLDQFFQDGEVLNLVTNPPSGYLDTLQYASDLLISKQLVVMDSDDESDIEKQDGASGLQDHIQNSSASQGNSAPAPPVEHARSNPESLDNQELSHGSQSAEGQQHGADSIENTLEEKQVSGMPYVAPVTRSRDGTLPTKLPSTTESAAAAHPVKASSRTSKSQPTETPVAAKLSFINVTSDFPKDEPAQVRERIRATTHPIVLDAPRPVDPTPIDLVLYAPRPEPGLYVKREFSYAMFPKYASDRLMIQSMLESQVHKQDGLPLFLQPNARNPDPSIRPSREQSVFFVCTRAEFHQLDRRIQYLIHRHRCVIMLETAAEPPPPFDEATLSRFRDTRQPCPIQDMGLIADDSNEDSNEDPEYFLRSAPLIAMLPHPDRPVLNAIFHPLPHSDVPLPPGFHYVASSERAMTHLHGHPRLPDVPSPWGDIRWGLVATKNARSPSHQDILATVITVLTGAKLIGIAVPLYDILEENGYEGDLGSRHAVDNWADFQATGNMSAFRWEVFLLLPGMSFYMQHGARHFVISLEDTIAYGAHMIHAAQAVSAVQVILHHIVTEDATTNTTHDSTRWLLVRMFIFWAEKLCTDAPLEANHFPEIQSKEGLLELLYIQSFVILFPAFDVLRYADAPGTSARFGVALSMPKDRYLEYEYAMLCIARLGYFIDLHFDVVYDNDFEGICCSTFQELVELAVTTMAGCLSRYRHSWIAAGKGQAGFKIAKGFTAKAFDQQLSRALAGYNSVLEAFSDREFDPEQPLDIHLQEPRIAHDFEAGLRSDAQFLHFLPWDTLSRGVPMSLKRVPITGDIRGRSEDSDDAADERPRKRHNA